MPQPAKPVVAIYDFLGLNDEPRSSVNLPPGTAAEQLNAQSVIEGELLVRRGCREVTFEAT